MRIYCLKQKKVTECIKPMGYKTAKNVRLMHFCNCAECGIKKTRFIKNQKGGENPLGKAFEATKIAEQLVRKLIPRTDHVFSPYWDRSMAKSAFGSDKGITSKKFWSHPKKGTQIRVVKNPKTGKYENVYIEPGN